MAMMSFLLPEKPLSASLGISAQLWRAIVNKARGKKRERLYVPFMPAPTQILFDRRRGWAGAGEGGGA